MLLILYIMLISRKLSFLKFLRVYLFMLFLLVCWLLCGVQGERSLLLAIILFIYFSYFVTSVQFSSVQFSRSVMYDSLWPHESQHARPPCSSPTPGVHSDSRPSSQWCHPAISSSVVPFSSCPQSLPASVLSNESTLRTRWPKYWSFSFSIIPSKEKSPLEWAGWISLQSKGLSRVFS